jgi:hypothetical protein
MRNPIPTPLQKQATLARVSIPIDRLIAQAIQPGLDYNPAPFD